jgi:predicted MPP superfamily phosphohydrolase
VIAMPRPVSFAIFFAIAIGVVFGLHFYFWARLVRDTALPPPWRTLATVAIALLGLSLPLSMLVLRRLAPSAGRLLLLPAYVWMGLMLLLAMSLAGADIMRACLRLAGALPSRAADPERRLFVQRLLAASAALVGAALGGAATVIAARRVGVRELRVPLRRLPRALDGTTIVQLTDMHVGPTLGRDFVEQVVGTVNALAPDVVAITGDLVDGSVEQLRESVAPLASLRARHGVYFVTGNHEYYSGVGAWLEELSRLGIRVLRNERVPIGDGAQGFDLAGIDDHSSRGMAPGHGPDLGRALAGRDPAREVVLLAHQPRAIHEAARHGVGLQLSGHTHGGQIWPWGYLVRLQQPYVAGYAREGDTHLYVSRGTGYWGPPMRLGAPAEITRIVLAAAES